MKKSLIIAVITITIFITSLFLIMRGGFKGSQKQIRINKNSQGINIDTGASEESQINNGTEINNDQNNASAAGEIKSENTVENKTMTPPKIIDKLANWGYAKSSGRSINTVIIHTSYDVIGKNPYSLSGILSEYKGIDVSPHYLIDRSGNIYGLVSEQNIAYHAGAGKTPDGRTNVNSFSIGVELMNTKIDKPTGNQYESLKNLLTYLKGKYKIKYVLGHSDIAPGRKDDPWSFDWGKLK
jgi:N-acetyl-anhydromuramyl-L-alanine amidase AmpD